MPFFIRYPASAASINLSVGPNGSPIPTSSTEIGGKNGSGNLTPVSVNAAGAVNVVVDSTTPVDANVKQWGGVNTTLGQKAMATSVPVAISSDQSAVPISAASLPLPTGASTSALQTTGNTSLSSIDGKTPALGQALAAASVPVVLTAAQVSTLTPLSTVAATQSGTWNINNISGTVSLPTGAASEATLSAMSAKLPATLGQKVKASSLAVTLASDQGTIPISPSVNTNGSIVNTSLTATTASSAAAPANTVGFILEAPSDNTNNIRWCIGSTASTTVGMLTEPGRDSGYVPCAATISICATASGTNAYSIQWILSS